jgi:DNA repair exonuclease SbcCD ATPase subunit
VQQPIVSEKNIIFFKIALLAFFILWVAGFTERITQGWVKSRMDYKHLSELPVAEREGILNPSHQDATGTVGPDKETAEREVETLRGLNDGLTTIKTDLEAQVKNLSRDNKRQADCLEEKASRIAELERQISQHKQVVEERSREEDSAVQGEVERLARENKDLTAERDELAARNRGLAEEKEALIAEARAEFIKLNQAAEVMQNKVAEQENRIAQLTKEAPTATTQAELDNLVAARTEELVGLRDEYNALIAQGRSELAENEKQYEEKRRVLDDIFNRALVEKDNQLAEKEALIVNQARAEIDLLNRQIEEKNMELATKNGQIADRDNQLAERINQSIAAGRQLAEREQQISILSVRLVEKEEQITSLTADLADKAFAELLEAEEQPSHDLTLATQKLVQDVAEASQKATTEMDSEMNQLSEFIAKCKGERKEDVDPVLGDDGNKPRGLSDLIRDFDPEHTGGFDFLSRPYSPNPDLPPDCDDYVFDSYDEAAAILDFNTQYIASALAPPEPVAEQSDPKGKGKRLAETESDEEERHRKR